MLEGAALTRGGKKSIALTFMVSMFFVGNKTYFTLLNEVYCQTL